MIIDTDEKDVSRKKEIKMKTIKTKNGKFEIVKNERDLYDVYYYEYYSSTNEYRLIRIDTNYTKELIDEIFA